LFLCFILANERRPGDRLKLVTKPTETKDNVTESSPFFDDWIPLTTSVDSSLVLLKNRQNGDVTAHALAHQDPTEEDWDEEIKVNADYNSVISTCDNRKSKESSVINDFQNTVNRYPPAKQAYSSTAFYDSFVYGGRDVISNASPKPVVVGVGNSDLITKGVERLSVVFGQFDDAEE